MAAAAPMAPSRIIRRGGRMSDRVSAAEVRAPATNPTWTAIVSQAAAVDERSHSATSWGSAAVAENQVVIASRTATARIGLDRAVGRRRNPQSAPNTPARRGRTNASTKFARMLSP